jgi:hypothetical protein
MNHVIDITPEGLKTQEGQNRVKEAMAAKDAAAWEAVRQFRELMRATSYETGRQQLIGIVAVWYGDKETAKQLLFSCLSSLNAIDEANEEFLKAVAGR